MCLLYIYPSRRLSGDRQSDQTTVMATDQGGNLAMVSSQNRPPLVTRADAAFPSLTVRLTAGALSFALPEGAAR